jgi:hypothetical protein
VHLVVLLHHQLHAGLVEGGAQRLVLPARNRGNAYGKNNFFCLLIIPVIRAPDPDSSPDPHSVFGSRRS